MKKLKKEKGKKGKHKITGTPGGKKLRKSEIYEKRKLEISVQENKIHKGSV